MHYAFQTNEPKLGVRFPSLCIQNVFTQSWQVSFKAHHQLSLILAPLRPHLQSKTGKNNIFPVFDQKQRSETELLAWRNLPALLTTSMFHPCKASRIP
jgi:hypothetical protein